MDPLLAIAALISVGAITPGPNNAIVLQTASRSGLAGALPAIGGVILGGLGLLAVAAGSGAALFTAQPGLRTALSLGGCLYLAWLGLRLLADSFVPLAADPSGRYLPAGVAGLAVFQFLNPKSWVLVLTAVAAMPADRPGAFLQLAALFLCIPAACLLLWSACGALLMRALADPRVRSWFDRVMGGTLAASAPFLFTA